MEWIKNWLLKLFAKRVISKITGKEKWEKSVGKIGAVLAGVVYIIEQILPAFGIEVNIPTEAFKIVEAFGITLAGWGIRRAVERTEDVIIDVKADHDSSMSNGR